MNDRLDLSRLAAATSSFPPYFEALEDETTWSYLTRAMLLTGHSGPRGFVTEALFGKPEIHIGRPVHSGLHDFADHLHLAGGLDEAVRRHAMLQLSAPFVDPNDFGRMKEKVGSESASGGGRQLYVDLVNNFRDTPAFCPACYGVDLAELPGVSYYRRSHQVRAVTHCAVHGEPLIEGCSACGAGFSHWHLPSMRCRECGAHLGVADEVQGEARALRIRLAQFVAAAFSGSLPCVPVPQRLAAIRDRVAQRVTNRSGIVGDNLARHLVRGFGGDYLKTLSLDPREAPALGWPMLMIHGRWMYKNPVANSIVLASVFDSPADYCASVMDAENLPEARLPMQRAIFGGENVSRELLRDSYGRPLEMVIREAGMSEPTLLWFYAYPGLQERRKKLTAWSFPRRNLGFRASRLLNFKDRLLKSKEMHPDITRTDLYKQEPSAVFNVRKLDPAWLDREFPRKPGYTGRRRKQVP